jgi:predicted  nucleic acid-binding Zn-ribbon protein
MTTETNKLRNALNSANRRQHDLEHKINSVMDFLVELKRLRELPESETNLGNIDLTVRLSTQKKEYSVRVPFKLLTEVNQQQLTCALESFHDQYSDENKQLVEAMEVFRKLVK